MVHRGPCGEVDRGLLGLGLTMLLLWFGGSLWLRVYGGVFWGLGVMAGEGGVSGGRGEGCDLVIR